MARPRTKTAHPVSFRIDEEMFSLLEKFCNDSGQSKTVAVERALKEYIEKYYKEQNLISKKSK